MHSPGDKFAVRANRRSSQEMSGNGPRLNGFHVEGRKLLHSSGITRCYTAGRRISVLAPRKQDYPEARGPSPGAADQQLA